MYSIVFWRNDLWTYQRHPCCIAKLKIEIAFICRSSWFSWMRSCIGELQSRQFSLERKTEGYLSAGGGGGISAYKSGVYNVDPFSTHLIVISLDIMRKWSATPMCRVENQNSERKTWTSSYFRKRWKWNAHPLLFASKSKEREHFASHICSSFLLIWLLK